jgi:CDP-L-myo-inositol myo-inositolphosphotransferase
MEMAAVQPGAAIRFVDLRQAERLVAGVPAVARILRELADAGFAEAWVELPELTSIEPAVRAEIHRVAPGMTTHVGEPPSTQGVVHFPADRLIPARAISEFMAGGPYEFVPLDEHGAAAAILRETAKPSDGIVSRWLNRPISRRLSAALLGVRGVRPIHATIGTAVIALTMFLALIGGGRAGLIAGAWLFQGASVFDGVDGEIARATFRTSRGGAALDSAVDMVTNVAAMLGLAINLALRGQPHALALVAWALSLFVSGLIMIGRRAHRETGSINFDGVKHRYNGRFSGSLASPLMRLATLCTSRDFCALLYLALVLTGIPIAGLYLFAIVTPVWMVFVVVALWPFGGNATVGPESVA